MNDTSWDLESRIDMFLKGLDNRSRAMFWHLWIKGHAELAELRKVAEFESDMDALRHIRQVLNPRAQEHLGQPALVFHRLRLNLETGEQVLFNWWLDIDALSDGERKEPVVDLFEDTGTITVVAEAPGIEACRAEIGYKNGILTVRLPKIQQNEQPAAGRGSGKREDLSADIFDEGDCLVVILDIPGAEDGSMQVNLSEHGLRVLVNIRGSDLQRRVDLPCPVRQVRRQRYRNGILEIELEKGEV